MISLWNYLRIRAHEAVLAGIKDAVEEVEQGDVGSQHLQSSIELVQKLEAAEARPVAQISEPASDVELPKTRAKAKAAKKKTA